VGSGALSNAELFQQVHVERERLSSITLNIGEGVCAIDAAGELTFVNRAAAALIELPSLDIAIDDPVTEGAPLAPDFLLEPAREAMRTGRAIREDDARFLGQDGRAIPVAYTASAVLSDGKPSGAVITFRDITERKAFEDELHHHARYDSLTGLANRRLLVERLDQALRRSVLDRKTHALIFVDVDWFKSINDSLGYVTGDGFLVAIGARLKVMVRSGDLLARFGGDEFVVLLEDVGGVDVAVAAARRICAAVQLPILLPDGYELVASVSVGVALTEPGKSADDVLHNADVAMYETKAKGGEAPTGCSTRRRWGPVPPSGCSSRPTCAKGLSGMNSRCTTSRSTHSTGTHRRRRGPGPVAPSGERADQPGELHPDSRGDGTDPPAGPLRPGQGMRAGVLDPEPPGRRPADQHQPLAPAVPGERAPRARGSDAGGDRPAPGAAHFRDHREHAHGRPFRCPGDHEEAEQPGCAPGH
jgi:diguanylate cyclase (GGDEF)-like protein/PAS domain S-box-containing protein